MSAQVDKLIGEVLANRYQIVERLGEGAMGAVYRAKHVKVGRAFAVKVLHAQLLEDPKMAQRFEREAELAGRLRHPNVIGVVDVGETPDGMRYTVMDFAKGADLATLLEEAPFRPARVLHLTRQLLEGLYHAHEAGLIHRDFKPENVIVEKDDHGVEVPRIVDFGIAILREGGDSQDSAGRLTTNGLVLGTPHYMAPEQAVADPIDHRIDLFALGIVVYEMLCGRLPFDGSGAEIARANLLLDPPAISERVPYLEVDPLLEAFARRLMAKKRDQRPATAKAARELLDLVERDRDAAASALGIAAATRAPQVTQDVVPQPHVPLEAPPMPPQPSPITATLPADASIDEPAAPVRSRRRLVIAGGAALLAAAAIIVFATTRGGHDGRAEPEPPLVRAGTLAQTTPPAPAPRVVEDKPTAVANVPDVADTKPAELTNPAAADKPPATPRPARTKKPTDVKPAKPADQPPVDTPTKPVDKQPEPAAAEVPVNALVTQYSTVGRDLKALGDKATDLWPRYRMIQLNEALKAADKRAEASAILTQLQKLIATRK